MPSVSLPSCEPARDDADVAHGRGIRARDRAGQREAGNLLALGEPRQVVLLLGSVPYFSISSPGPSEFGTMTMVTTSGVREAILPMMSDCACAEKPSRHAPWRSACRGSRCSRMKCQISSGMSCSS